MAHEMSEQCPACNSEVDLSDPCFEGCEVKCWCGEELIVGAVQPVVLFERYDVWKDEQEDEDV